MKRSVPVGVGERRAMEGAAHEEELGTALAHEIATVNQTRRAILRQLLVPQAQIEVQIQRHLLSLLAPPNPPQNRPPSVVVLPQHGPALTTSASSSGKQQGPKLSRMRRGIKSDKHSSRHRGVTFQKRDSKYVARAWINKRMVHLGTFKTEEEAAERVRRKYLEVYGETPGNRLEDVIGNQTKAL